MRRTVQTVTVVEEEAVDGNGERSKGIPGATDGPVVTNLGGGGNQQLWNDVCRVCCRGILDEDPPREVLVCSDACRNVVIHMDCAMAHMAKGQKTRLKKKCAPGCGNSVSVEQRGPVERLVSFLVSGSRSGYDRWHERHLADNLKSPHAGGRAYGLISWAVGLVVVYHMFVLKTVAKFLAYGYLGKALTLVHRHLLMRRRLDILRVPDMYASYTEDVTGAARNVGPSSTWEVRMMIGEDLWREEFWYPGLLHLAFAVRAWLVVCILVYLWRMVLEPYIWRPISRGLSRVDIKSARIVRETVQRRRKLE